MRVIGRKKRKTVRDSGVINGVINGAVTQDAVCKDRWVQQNECKLFGGPVFEKPAAGLAQKNKLCQCQVRRKLRLERANEVRLFE